MMYGSIFGDGNYVYFGSECFVINYEHGVLIEKIK